MTKLSCGHDRAEAPSSLCEHMQRGDSPQSYVCWYTGQGTRAELLCRPCAKRRRAGEEIVVVSVCRECHDDFVEDYGPAASVAGEPEIRIADRDFELELRELCLPEGIGEVLDFVPVPSTPDRWWLLTGNAGLWSFDSDTGEAQRLAECSLCEESDTSVWNGREPRLALHASPCGRFAGVVRDYGRHGQVIDLERGDVTMQLEAGEYHFETVPFSFAFVALGGRSYAVHRTDWNRLDLSDPIDGTLLSAREPTSYDQDELEPEHYLDYFHGRLCVSPCGRRIADDGWLWHPVGIVRAWLLDAWLANAWESEDGPSVREVCAREAFWDASMLWLDATTLAVFGLGDDESCIIDGARIFDVTKESKRREAFHLDLSHEICGFAGPRGAFLSDGESLYSSDEHGLARWDWLRGERTGFCQGFSPTRRHPRSGDLAELVDHRALRLSKTSPLANSCWRSDVR